MYSDKMNIPLSDISQHTIPELVLMVVFSMSIPALCNSYIPL